MRLYLNADMENTKKLKNINFIVLLILYMIGMYIGNILGNGPLH